MFQILAVTRDDTTIHSAGSHGQLWLKNWTRLLPDVETVSFYSGADVVLVMHARASEGPDRSTDGDEKLRSSQTLTMVVSTATISIDRIGFRI